MATQANERQGNEKPVLKEQAAPPTGFKKRTMSYEIAMEDGGHILTHRLNAMTDAGLIMWQRGMSALEGLAEDVASVALIEVWTQAWFRMVVSVDGYDGIEDGQPVTAANVQLIPFYHINQALSQVLTSIGVIAGDDQKN